MVHLLIPSMGMEQDSERPCGRAQDKASGLLLAHKSVLCVALGIKLDSLLTGSESLLTMEDSQICFRCFADQKH